MEAPLAVPIVVVRVSDLCQRACVRPACRPVPSPGEAPLWPGLLPGPPGSPTGTPSPSEPKPELPTPQRKAVQFDRPLEPGQLSGNRCQSARCNGRANRHPGSAAGRGAWRGSAPPARGPRPAHGPPHPDLSFTPTRAPDRAHSVGPEWYRSGVDQLGVMRTCRHGPHAAFEHRAGAQRPADPATSRSCRGTGTRSAGSHTQPGTGQIRRKVLHEASLMCSLPGLRPGS